MCTFYSELGLHRKHTLTGETALSYSEVKTVIDYLLKTEEAIILGGDVLNLLFEYTYNNWYYKPIEDFSWSKHVAQSCEHTLQYIEQLNQPDKNLYILVLKERPM